MIASVGAQLYREADGLLARGAAAFQRAAAEPVEPGAEAGPDPADLPGAVLDVVAGGMLGRLGIALIGVERDRTESLIDILA